MATVVLVPEDCPDPIVQQVFADIKATKKINFIPNIWRALASNPEHLSLCWTRLKAIMKPGHKIDLLTKEIIALAVSVTNSCKYCINSHTAAVQKLGLDAEGFAEVLAVIGLYNQMNKLADALQIEPDIVPEPFQGGDLRRSPSTPPARKDPLTDSLQKPADPDLARLVEAWPHLPPHIRAAVMALVDAGRKTPQGG